MDDPLMKMYEYWKHVVINRHNDYEVRLSHMIDYDFSSLLDSCSKCGYRFDVYVDDLHKNLSNFVKIHKDDEIERLLSEIKVKYKIDYQCTRSSYW